MDLHFLATEWGYFTSAFVTLVFIVDPFAVVPVYLTITERFGAPGRRHIRIKATAIATVLLVFFALSGKKFFELFGITLPAFQIAGGILLLVLGISQLNAERKKVNNEETDEGLEKDDISVFPLATPLLAGPGAISTVILYATAAASPLRFGELLVAVLATMAVTFLILTISPALLRVLGRTGLNLLSRIMGIVLTAIAVQFILNGITEVWKQHPYATIPSSVRTSSRAGSP
jgi:multiple antibiotic resistance protein